MWYLVLPPIIVVLSLIFLLWYLSRKGADPSIAEKMSHLETDPIISFSRTKEFFLRILEKLAQHSKIRSLRMHNVLNDWTQTIKERRRQVHESVASQQSEEDTQKNPGFFGRFKKWGKKEHEGGIQQEGIAPVLETAVQEEVPVNVSSSDDLLRTPIVRSSRLSPRSDESGQRRLGISEKEVSQVSPKKAIQVDRPMVSETAAHPEGKRESLQDTSREEMFISRIALNPKDFTAYEALGDYYLKRGNMTDAKECYRQVLKLSPVQRMVKIKIRRLERLLSEQK